MCRRRGNSNSLKQRLVFTKHFNPSSNDPAKSLILLPTYFSFAPICSYVYYVHIKRGKANHAEQGRETSNDLTLQ